MQWYGVLFVLVLLVSAGVARADRSRAPDWHSLLKEPDPQQLMALARDYEKAEGARHDYGRARQLYCAAARLGHPPAQVRLAWMYAHGVGAPQDRELAAAWLRVAAASGSLPARKFLALLAQPPSTRKPRCTYSSRYDQYARATITTPATEATPSRRQIEAWVAELAPRYGLDPKLVVAMIKIESNFNPQANSSRNARGLMQLIPDTAARFGVRDRGHPVENLHGGMAYLRWLLAFFRGDLGLALAGYNAGEGAVERYRGIPPYAETQQYVHKVIDAFGQDSHPFIEALVPPSALVATDHPLP